MTRRVARVHRQILEPDHVRTMPGDQERRRPVRGRLDRERADQKRAEPPLPEERRNQPEARNENRQHHPARHDRPDQRRLRQVARPVVRKHLDETAVVVGDRPVRDQDPGDQETEQDRENRDGHVGNDNPDQKRPYRMDAAGEARQAGDDSIPAVENGRNRTATAGLDGALLLLRFNSLRITVLVAIGSGPPGRGQPGVLRIVISRNPLSAGQTTNGLEQRRRLPFRPPAARRAGTGREARESSE